MNDPANLEIMKAGRKAAYQFTLRDKIAGAMADLRLRFHPRRVLVAGPLCRRIWP